SKFENSYKKLERIYPFYKINKNKSDIKTANGNKYRSNGNEIYFICKKHENDDEFIEEGLTINIEDYSTISKKFKEEEYKISETKLNKHIKKLANINFLGFKDLLENTRNNYVLKNNIDKSAIYSHTPYLRFDVVYHKQYGVIDKTILQ